jgi:hypothetical protein
MRIGWQRHPPHAPAARDRHLGKRHGFHPVSLTKIIAASRALIAIRTPHTEQIKAAP